MKKGTIAFIGMIIGLVFLIVGLIGPWYVVNENGSFMGSSIDVNVGLYLTRMDVQGTAAGQTISQSMSYADAKATAGSTGLNTDSFSTIDTIMFLTLGAVIFAILAVICFAGFLFMNSKKIRLAGTVFGFLTFLFALIAPLYFMTVGLTQAKTGFWSSTTLMGLELSLGPGYAWYLMIAAAIIVLIATVGMLLLKKQVPEAVPAQEATPPQIS